MTTQHSTIRPPSLWLTGMEFMRSSLESASLVMHLPFLANMPKGDGHPVLVLPGFATNDNSTLLLRNFLSAKGYDVQPWGLGRNFDHRTIGANGERVAHQLDRIVDRTGRKISLVGWSLGGVIAREAARRDPDAVRQVISLGSPFGGNPHATNVRALYELLSGNRIGSPHLDERYKRGSLPLDVPSTAVYSKTDGIAAWQNCIADPHELTENIEVNSSHFGLVAHPAVYHILADRLAQEEGEWKPFDDRGLAASGFVISKDADKDAGANKAAGKAS